MPRPLKMCLQWWLGSRVGAVLRGWPECSAALQLAWKIAHRLGRRAALCLQRVTPEHAKALQRRVRGLNWATALCTFRQSR